MADPPTGGKVKIPGLGQVNKKTAIIGSVAVIGAGGVWYWRRQKAGQASALAAQSQAATNATGMVTDPAGNQCAATDPNSGYCPGTPEDQSYQQQQGGYGIGVGSYGGGAGGYYGNTGQLCPDGSIPRGYDQFGNPICTPQPTGPVAITTNDQWVQEVDKLFPNSVTAISKVLGGVTVTTAEKNQFLEAVGVFGPPPGGYPKPIKTSDTPGHPGKPTDVTIPKVTGKHEALAISEIRLAQLVPHVTKTLTKGPPGVVVSQNPDGGDKAKRGSVVTIDVNNK